MARGGLRPGAGRPKGSKKGVIKQKKVDNKPTLPPNDQKQAEIENLSPLSYMLKVMNDSSIDPDRRDKMAIAAAPFMHVRPGAGVGKKDEKDEKAKAAASGRFKPSSPPALKAVK